MALEAGTKLGPYDVAPVDYHSAAAHERLPASPLVPLQHGDAGFSIGFR